jgi:hypothetical protein
MANAWGIDLIKRKAVDMETIALIAFIEPDTQ